MQDAKVKVPSWSVGELVTYRGKDGAPPHWLNLALSSQDDVSGLLAAIEKTRAQAEEALREALQTFGRSAPEMVKLRNLQEAQLRTADHHKQIGARLAEQECRRDKLVAEGQDAAAVRDKIVRLR